MERRLVRLVKWYHKQRFAATLPGKSIPEIRLVKTSYAKHRIGNSRLLRAYASFPDHLAQTHHVSLDQRRKLRRRVADRLHTDAHEFLLYVGLRKYPRDLDV